MNTPNKCQRPLLAKQPASQGVGMQTLSAKVGEQMAKGAELDALIRKKLGGWGMSFEPTKKETSAPVTAAKSGRGSSEAHAAILRRASREQHTPFLPGGIKSVFPRMPKSLHKRKDRKNDLEQIRGLRNRVFHHERIVHWRDLDAQHDLILNVIGWISPPLRQVTQALERFQLVRAAGLTPFLTHPIWSAGPTKGAGV